MKILVLTVLFAVIQTPAPVPRKAANPSNRASQNVKSDPRDNQPPSQQQPSLIQPISPKPDQNASHSPTTENAQKPVIVRELPPVSVTKDWWDRIYIIFTGVLIVVGIVGVRAAYKTLGEMKAQREAMQGQLTAMQGQITQMENAGRQTDKLISEAAKQTRELHDATDIYKVSADAAKLSADIAARIAVPTLVIEKFELADMGAANLEAKLQSPLFNIVVRNYGQTPALLYSWNIILATGILPDEPVYDADGIVLEKEIVKPGDQYTLPQLYFPHRRFLDLNVVKEVIEQKEILTVYGFIAYGDIFGNPLWRVKFCESVLNISPDYIQWCSWLGPSSYRGIDHWPFKKKTAEVKEEAN